MLEAPVDSLSDDEDFDFDLADSDDLTDTPPPDGEGEFISLLFSNSDCSDGATGG